MAEVTTITIPGEHLAHFRYLVCSELEFSVSRLAAQAEADPEAARFSAAEIAGWSDLLNQIGWYEDGSEPKTVTAETKFLQEPLERGLQYDRDDTKLLGMEGLGDRIRWFAGELEALEVSA